MSYQTTIAATGGLANYWKLDEPSGASAADAAGSASLTIAGGVTLNQTSLAAGTAFLFNGTTGKLTRASAVLAAAANTSVEAWVKTTDLAKTRQPIFFAGDADSDGWGLIVNGYNGSGYDTDGSLYLLVGGVAWTDTGVNLAANTIYYVALTLDASRIPRLYVNGTLVWTGSAITPNAPSKFCVGCDEGTAPDAGFFKGLIDEVAAYTVKLSAATISAHFDAGVTTPATAVNMTMPAATTGPLNASMEVQFQPDGLFTGNITPTATGGGSFAPATLNWAGTASTRTAVYTPASTGAKTIACTNDGGLANPTGQTYTVVANGFAYQAAQDGNWSERATWGGIGPPQYGDTVTVTGHSTVVDADFTIGNATVGATVLTLETSGKTLTINSGVTLKVRGNTLIDSITNNGAATDLILTGSAVFEADSSLIAGTPNLTLILGNTNNSGVTRLTGNGTANARWQVRSNAGGGVLTIGQNTLFRGCTLDLTEGTFLRVGNASNGSIGPAVEANQSLTRVDFNACGTFGNATGITKDKNFILNGCRWLNTPAATNCVQVPISNNNGDVGTRSVTNCSFDRGASLPMLGMSPADNFFAETVGAAGSHYGSGTLTRCFIRSLDVNPTTRVNDWLDNYFVVDGSTYDGFGRYSATGTISNPHWTNPVVDAVLTVTGTIFDSFGSTGDGDVDYGPNAASRNSRFLNCIILPDQLLNVTRPLNAGTLATVNGWNGAACVYEHCTVYGATQGLLALAEGGNGFAGMVSSFRSNIGWSYGEDAGQGFNKLAYYPTSPAGAVNNQIVAAACGWNCAFNLNPAHSQTGSKAYYDIRFSDNTLVGQHDVVGDPQFVDPTRNFATWVGSVEPTWGAGEVFPANGSPSRTDYNAHGLYKLSLSVCGRTADADYDSRYTVAALLAHVRAGFAPQNDALQDAGHDGETIGAEEFAAPATATRPGAAHIGMGISLC